MLTRSTGLILLPAKHFNDHMPLYASKVKSLLQIGKDDGGTFCKQAARSGAGFPPTRTRARHT